MSKLSIDDLYKGLTDCCGNKVTRLAAFTLKVKWYGDAGTDVLIGRSAKPDRDYRIRHGDDIVHVRGKYGVFTFLRERGFVVGLDADVPKWQRRVLAKLVAHAFAHHDYTDYSVNDEDVRVLTLRSDCTTTTIDSCDLVPDDAHLPARVVWAKCMQQDVALEGTGAGRHGRVGPATASMVLAATGPTGPRADDECKDNGIVYSCRTSEIARHLSAMSGVDVHEANATLFFTWDNQKHVIQINSDNDCAGTVASDLLMDAIITRTGLFDPWILMVERVLQCVILECVATGAGIRLRLAFPEHLYHYIVDVQSLCLGTLAHVAPCLSNMRQSDVEPLIFSAPLLQIRQHICKD